MDSPPIVTKFPASNSMKKQIVKVVKCNVINNLNFSIPVLIESILMVSALSVDTFVASFAYGTGKIRIPFSSVFLISFVCSAVLSCSMLLGSLVGPCFPHLFTKTAAFCVLTGLGLYYIMHPQNTPDADKDHSKSLSLKESAVFAFAMSIDNTAVGVSAGLLSCNFIYAAIICLILTTAVVKGGSVLGWKAAGLSKKDHSWVGGLLLILLALMQLS